MTSGMRSDYAVVTTRSPRIALVLPDLVGTRLEAELDRALEWFGRVWGGAHMICLPPSGTRKGIFGRLVTAYDPDLVLPWQPTLGSTALADLDTAREHVRRALAAQGGQAGAGLVALQDDDALLRSTWPYGGRADIGWAKEAAAAFDGPEQSAGQVAFHLQTEFPAPLTRLDALRQPPADWLRQASSRATAGAMQRATLAQAASDLDLTGLDPWRRKLLKGRYALVGSAAGASQGLMQPNERPRVLQVDPERDLHWCAVVGLLGQFGAETAPAWTHESLLAAAPLPRTTTGLQVWSRDRMLPRHFLLVVGDSVEDYCLYLAWHRLYGEGTAAWLPAAAAEGIGSDHASGHAPDDDSGDAWEGTLELVREMLTDLPGRTYDRGSLTSFSVSEAALDALRRRLSTFHWHPEVQARVLGLHLVRPEALDVPAAPAHWLATGDVFERAVPLLLHDDGSAGSILRSPVPELLLDGGRGGTSGLLGNWVLDVVVAGCRLPARARSARAAELDASLVDAGFVRVGRTGTAAVAVATDTLPDGLLVDHALTGLSVRDPDLRRLADVLLPRGVGWQLSDAGRYYQGLADLTGGTSALIALLRDPVTRSVLEGFLADRPSVGVKAGDRWHLSSADARRLVQQTPRRGLDNDKFDAGDTLEAGAIVQAVRRALDHLLERGILTRGLVLKCSRCRKTSFHRLDDLGPGFDCPRCSFAQRLDSATWWHTPPDEPTWFYRLDELAYQALRHNVRVPALALAALGADGHQARHLWSIELMLEGKRQVELDFVALVDGHLIVGEAKSNPSLSPKEAAKEVGKLLRGARLIQADVVVFATTGDAWSNALRDAAGAHFDGINGPRLRTLTALT